VLIGLPPRVDAEAIFTRYFLPLVPADQRNDLARSRTVDANPGRNSAILEHLDDAANRFVHNAPALFGANLVLDRSDASVHRLSAALTPALRDTWASQGPAGTPDSLLFNAVVHGAAYVGACIVEGHAGVWGVRRPLWESVVTLRSPAGEADLAVFHWWLKSLSDEILQQPTGATLADRYRAHVEVPCAAPEVLPVLVEGERALPRLERPTYDRFHKYLRAHLPEVKHVGEHFPSAERFAAFAFRWMDFHIVGGGRNVVLAGVSQDGLHLIWLGRGGFEKSAFVSGDAVPEPIVRIEGPRIMAMIWERGQVRVRDMLWWGP
jgi:hypothetical protein